MGQGVRYSDSARSSRYSYMYDRLTDEEKAALKIKNKEQEQADFWGCVAGLGAMIALAPVTGGMTFFPCLPLGIVALEKSFSFLNLD